MQFKTCAHGNIGWAAGLFEGEGSVWAQQRRGQGAYQGLCSLTTTDLDVLERFVEIVGVGKIRPFKVQIGRKPAWRWTVSSRADVEHVGRLVIPYLGSRRLQRFEEVLDKIRSNDAPGGWRGGRRAA